MPTHTGVDISAGMLARARDRSLYDELAEREFTSFLTASARRFDLVVAGDVLCYFGDLSSITSAIARSLAPGGRLFLTLEKNTGDQGEREPGYRLQPHGRYCHAQTYVARVMANTGLEVELLTTEVLRQEAGESVTGLLVGLRQPAGGDRP